MENDQSCMQVCPRHSIPRRTMMIPEGSDELLMRKE